MTLQEARQAQGITQTELSRLAGIPQPSISRIELGVRSINDMTFASVARLADALGVDILELLEPGWDRP